MSGLVQVTATCVKRREQRDARQPLGPSLCDPAVIVNDLYSFTHSHAIWQFSVVVSSLWLWSIVTE